MIGILRRIFDMFSLSEMYSRISGHTQCFTVNTLLSSQVPVKNGKTEIGGRVTFPTFATAMLSDLLVLASPLR